MVRTRHSDLIERLDEAVLEPSLWSAVLDDVADLVSASSSALLSVGSGTAVWSKRLAPEAVGLFRARFYMAKDNLIQAGLDRLRNDLGYVPVVVTDRSLCSRDKFIRSALFNEFMAPHGGFSSLVVDLGIGADTAAYNVTRSPKQGEFTKAEVQRLARLQPHLRRAYRMTARLGASGIVRDGLEQFVDRSTDALFVLSADGRVRHLNAEAATLIGRGTELAIAGGRLAAVDPAYVAAFSALIHAAAASDPVGRSSGELGLPRREGGEPLSLLATGARGNRYADFMGGPSVILSAAGDRGVRAPGRLLRDRFGLTPAEAKVALALAEGLSTRTTAEAMGLSITTIRTHLMRVFSKTDTHRQSDVVRLVLGLRIEGST